MTADARPERHLLGAMAGEMSYLCELAHAGKIAQGRFIARRN